MRKRLKIALLAAAVPALVIAAGLAWLGRQYGPPEAALPPLVRGLPGNFEQRARGFHQRVLAGFPPGMPVSQLMAELRRQGFDLREGAASFEQKDLVCTHDWIIRWKTAESGRVASLDARDATGCL